MYKRQDSRAAIDAVAATPLTFDAESRTFQFGARRNIGRQALDPGQNARGQPPRREEGPFEGHISGPTHSVVGLPLNIVYSHMTPRLINTRVGY